MTCPICGSDGKCVETRPKEGWVYRRYKCVEEGHKFKSCEIPLLDVPDGVPGRPANEEPVIVHTQSQGKEKFTVNPIVINGKTLTPADIRDRLAFPWKYANKKERTDAEN